LETISIIIFKDGITQCYKIVDNTSIDIVVVFARCKTDGIGLTCVRCRITVSTIITTSILAGEACVSRCLEADTIDLFWIQIAERVETTATGGGWI